MTEAELDLGLEDEIHDDRLGDDELGENELGQDKLTADDVSDVVTYTLDWSVQSLLEKIGTTFDINPAFQRRDAWNSGRKSLYIESLMLGLPVPQIVLAEDREHKGRFIVLDGKQRLITVKQFASPGEHFRALKLSKVEFLTQFRNMTCEKMARTEEGEGLIENLLAQPVRTIVVRNWGRAEVLYQIFARLNQYSVQLSPQELRQALYPGEFTFWITNRSADSEYIRRARRLKAPDFRMRDAEMLLRAIAFRERLEDYEGNLRAFLDQMCQFGNLGWTRDVEKYEHAAKACERAIAHTFAIFGENAFYRYHQDEAGHRQYIGRFNTALYDLMCTVLAEDGLDEQIVETNADSMRAAFEQLCVSDARFQDIIKSTTKTERATADRILRYGAKVREITGVDLPVLERAQRLLDMQAGKAGE